jgi:hypothetical protein
MKLRTAIYTLIAAIIWTTAPVYADEIVINAVGDIMLADRWAATIRKNGYDSPFLSVSHLLKSGTFPSPTWNHRLPEAAVSLLIRSSTSGPSPRLPGRSSDQASIW